MQVSLGNGVVFILVKLENSNDIIDFVVLPVFLIFLRQKNKVWFCYMINLKKGVVCKSWKAHLFKGHITNENT